MFHSVCVSARAGGARTPCPRRKGCPRVCVCVCVGASTGLGRAGERFAKPRRSTPRAAPARRELWAGAHRGSRGRCGVRLRGQRWACRAGAEGKALRTLVPLRRGARGGDEGTGVAGPACRRVHSPGAQIACRAGAAPAPPASAGGTGMPPPPRPGPLPPRPQQPSREGLGGCPRAERF